MIQERISLMERRQDSTNTATMDDLQRTEDLLKDALQ